MKDKIRPLAMWIGLKIDILGGHMIGISSLDSWIESFGSWIQGIGSHLFAWAYDGSDDEFNDALEWAGDWLTFDLPIRWDFLSKRQTQIVIEHFGIGPVMRIRQEAA